MADNLDAYDTSDYPVDHTIQSKTHAKVQGKTKNKCWRLEPQEFVGLRTKMNNILQWQTEFYCE